VYFWCIRIIYVVNTFYEYNEITFVWDTEKAKSNFNKHAVRFEEAITVFDDPFFITTNADRNNEERNAIIGLDTTIRLLFVVHIEQDETVRRANKQEELLYANQQN